MGELRDPLGLGLLDTTAWVTVHDYMEGFSEGFHARVDSETLV